MRLKPRSIWLQNPSSFHYNMIFKLFHQIIPNGRIEWTYIPGEVWLAQWSTTASAIFLWSLMLDKKKKVYTTFAFYSTIWFHCHINYLENYHSNCLCSPCLKFQVKLILSKNASCLPCSFINLEYTTPVFHIPVFLLHKALDYAADFKESLNPL